MAELRGAKSVNVAENSCGMQGHILAVYPNSDFENMPICSKCCLTLDEVRKGRMEDN